MTGTNIQNTIIQNITEYKIEGMGCVSCVTKIENALSTIADSAKISVNLDTGTAKVFGDIDPELVLETITNSGYKANILETK